MKVREKEREFVNGKKPDFFFLRQVRTEKNDKKIKKNFFVLNYSLAYPLSICEKTKSKFKQEVIENSIFDDQ